MKLACFDCEKSRILLEEFSHLNPFITDTKLMKTKAWVIFTSKEFETDYLGRNDKGSWRNQTWNRISGICYERL